MSNKYKELNREMIVRICEACHKERDFFVALLKDFVLFETPTQNHDRNREFLEILAERFDELGCKVKLLPREKSGGQLTAQLKGNKFEGNQLLLGHADTVWPVGTLEKLPWKQSGNIITGPGAYDMKAGLVMMITALNVLRKLELKPKLQPVIFINSDEETGSRDSRKLVESLAKSTKRAFVPEPSLDTDGKLKTRRKGSGIFKVEVEGIAAHAGIEPEKGISAIQELSYVIQTLCDLNDPERGITVNVGKINGGSALNVVPAEAAAHLNVRILAVEDMERVEEEIRSIQPVLEGTTVKVKGGFRRPPLEKNERNTALWNLAQNISGVMKLDLKEGTTGGGSDGSFASLHTAVLDGLGAVGEGAHSLSEKIFLDETMDRVALFTALLMAPDVQPER